MRGATSTLAVTTAIVAAMAWSVSAAGQPGQERRRARAEARQRFTEMDTDRDGTISRAEWRGSPQSFRVHDWNRDGVLSGAELREAVQQAQNDGLPDYDEGGGLSDWSGRRFASLDTNRDGFLTRRELAGATDDDTERARLMVGGSETRWIDTGLFVYAGDLVRFEASGTVQMSTDVNDVADPGGARSNRRASSAPLPQQPAGALIARIDQGGPIFVGDNRSGIRMPQTGRLYLSVNDDHLPDNVGQFSVSVEVQRSTF